MEYRNPGLATHYGKGGVWGTDSNVGTEIQGSTITSASDSAASGLTVRAKGTGALSLGDSSNVTAISGGASVAISAAGTGTVTVGNSSNVVTISGGASVTLGADGTGKVNLGNSSNVVYANGSTTPIKIVAGLSTTTIPNMPGASQDVSTFAMAGASTGDLLLCVDHRATVSTQVAMGGYTIVSADKARVTWINCHASSISPETTGVSMRWAYIDRT